MMYRVRLQIEGGRSFYQVVKCIDVPNSHTVEIVICDCRMQANAANICTAMNHLVSCDREIAFPKLEMEELNG